MNTVIRVLAAISLLGLAPGQLRAQATTVPDDRNFAPNPSAQTSWEDYLATKKGKPVDIVFVGDSITEQWRWGGGKPVWQKLYADRALVFAKGGDRTQNVLWRLQNLDVRGFRPKVAVILIGTNNTPDTPEDIAAGVWAVIRQTAETFHDPKIILCSILPNQRANEKMRAVNALIQQFADEKSIFYLDLAASFPPEGESWKGLHSDRLHLTTAGYEAWAAAIDPLLAKLELPTPSP